MKKLVSVLLAISLLFSVFAVSASATVKAECGGKCDTCPSIVVPGIGQSNIWHLTKTATISSMPTAKKLWLSPQFLT